MNHREPTSAPAASPSAMAVPSPGAWTRGPALALSCDAALEAFQDALDERLAPAARPLALQAHLADCAACREHAQGFARVHEAGDLLARRLGHDARAARLCGRVLTWVPVAAAGLVAVGIGLGAPDARPEGALAGAPASMTTRSFVRPVELADEAVALAATFAARPAPFGESHG